MSTAIKEATEARPRLIQIRGRSVAGAGQGGEAPPSQVEELREEVARGFLYAHSRANVNSSKLLEVSAFSYALIELLAERGLITVEELDERKAEVSRRLAEKFAERGMGVALTAEEKDADGAPLNAEIDCEARLHLCHAACCRLRFALTARDVEEGRVKWNLGQPYMIRQGDDGYCHHLDRPSQRCGIYEERPFVCRAYDCRGDKRIWEDFEQRQVSPELENLIERLGARDCNANPSPIDERSAN
ncbi:MAG TPA: YkgJ family cysteine cluster protein [Pyrinomonadaceae bacterium]|jgi:Fe-S-cluster containining protein|nr:YkgJ family cysteine cluster protein [Pyrinomonadaceae bacterium]